MSQRLDRINQLIKQEVSSIIQKSFEFRDMLVTVSEAKVTQDLREAKVYISVLGGNAEPVLKKLSDGKAKIQAQVNKRVTMRCTPVLDFRSDNSAERGVNIVNLLEEVDRLPTADREDEEEVL